MISFNSIIQWFLPKENKFYDLLEKQADLLIEVSGALSELRCYDNFVLADKVKKLEHDGDALVVLVESELAKTFVTPLDAEDIHKLSDELDDVIDYCNQALQACIIYGIKHPTNAMFSLALIISKCGWLVGNNIKHLRTHNYEQFFDMKASVKSLEKQADKIFRDELSELFNNKCDYRTIIAQKEVLKKFENAIDCCEKITKFLSTLAIKYA
jgi:uncharacterized protein Yka (UPF0111/DUF47 family)